MNERMSSQCNNVLFSGMFVTIGTARNDVPECMPTVSVRPKDPLYTCGTLCLRRRTEQERQESGITNLTISRPARYQT